MKKTTKKISETQIIRILSALKGAALANPNWSKEELIQSAMLACICTREDCLYALNHSPLMSEYEAYDFIFCSNGLGELCDEAIK